RTLSIGFSHVSSHAMNAASTPTPIASDASTLGALQPSLGASMMPQSSATKPTIESKAPNGSSLPASGSFEDGNRNRPAISTAIVSGTLIKNTEPHQKC